MVSCITLTELALQHVILNFHPLNFLWKYFRTYVHWNVFAHAEAMKLSYVVHNLETLCIHYTSRPFHAL
jgi:hypothetical protein